MGGTDEEDNLILLSIEDHAEAHRKLYEKYGLQEDKVAWLGLSKQIGKEEMFRLRSSIGGKKKKPPRTEQHRQKISDSLKGRNVGGVERHTEGTKQRISKKMSGKNHPFYGKEVPVERKNQISDSMKEYHTVKRCCVFSTTEKRNKLVPILDLEEWLDQGWICGRKNKF
jgi:hypothetical protein